MKKAILTAIRLSPDLRKKVESICRSDGRSMAFFLGEAIRFGLPVMRRIEGFKKSLIGRPIRIGDFRTCPKPQPKRRKKR